MDLSEKIHGLESEEMSDALSSEEGQVNNDPKKTCTYCGTAITPKWRSGPTGPKSLGGAEAQHASNMGGAGGSTIVAGGGAEGPYVEANISVWWDINNCENNWDTSTFTWNIRRVLNENNYYGPFIINAYGDLNGISADVIWNLRNTMHVYYVPSGIEYTGVKKTILTKVLMWTIDNPTPANILLITGDADYYSNALHRLSMKKYDILLVLQQNAPASLVGAAKVVLPWTTLLAQ